MNIKKITTLLLLFSLSSLFAQNSLVVKNIEAGPGATSKIILALENENEVSGFQFVLKTPNNLIVNEKEVSFIGRNTNHIIYPKRNGNGEYLFICFSATNDNFLATEGDLFEIPIEIPLTYLPDETYDIEINDVILSSNTGEDIGSNHQNGVLTIVEGENPDLVVENIIFSNSTMIPSEPFTINWEVSNIGESIALGGWREQIYISSENNDKEYLVRTETFSGDLIESGRIERSTAFNVPPVVGFDGDVKIKIELKPYSSVKETAALQLNNTSFSDAIGNLQKKIIFNLDTNEIIKNSGDEIRVDIKRSGDISMSEEFTITSSSNDFFELPVSVVIEENKSSNIAFIPLLPSETYSGNLEIIFTASGGDYTNETKSITLIEDKKINLSINYAADYSSNIGDKIEFNLTSSNSNPVDKLIRINTNNSSRIDFPNEVTMRAGETSLIFEGTILDTGATEKRETIEIYAEATDYLTGISEIELKAINIPDFELELAPVVVSEGDGIAATYATLKRSTHTDKEVVIEMSSNNNDRLILPSAFIFEAGELEKKFNIGTVDNSIVEGDQVINVFAKIVFDDCNCSDDNDETTITQSQLTVIDNDGLALTLTASPSTIKAGTSNNILTLSRNTTDSDILENSVEVSFTNNVPSVVTMPNSVIIPSGENEVEVLFDTEIDPLLEGDQSVRIEASADEYATGFSWFLITDQNQPDVIITDIEMPNEIEGASTVAITTSVTNQGYADFSSSAKLDYYLSENNSIAGLTPFNTTILPQGITSGETYNFSEEVQLPVFSGQQNIIVVVNSDRALNELSFTNNQKEKEITLLPAYNVSIALDKQVYLPNESVFVSGEAKTNQTNETVGISDVEITISNNEFVRVFTAKTNANGAFVFEFEPVENESGNYSVAASYPGAKVDAQATFDILGFEIVDKEQYIKWEPFVGFPLEKQFVLKNNTSVDLTGITINLPNNAAFEIEQTSINIASGQQVAFNFNIISNEATMEEVYIETPLEITSTEGAVLKETIYFYSKTKTANLVANPISINTTMAKDVSRFYEFTVKNIGDVNANNIEVLLPPVAWMSLKSTSIIDVIEADSEAKIVLELTPTPTEQINIPISGTIVLNGENSNALTIPFRVETVSEATGSILVDATDEYTFNTVSAPHLAGALVEIKHPYTGEIVAQGITDENGLFEVPVINEGYYTVNVSAEKHNPYQNTILVDPAKTTRVNAFMQYQAVTYSWQVVPTEIEDEYEITLVTEFETNVPKPVIVMELDNSNLDLEPGESRLVNLNITNHGLVYAYDVKIGTTAIPEYEVSPLITAIDTLSAKTSKVIPVLLKREPGVAAKTLRSNKTSTTNASAKTLNGSCASGSITFEAAYPCDTDEKIFSFTALNNSSGGNCSAPDLNISVDIGPGYPTFGGSGGGGLAPYSGGTYSPTTFPDLCDPCTNSIVSTILSCNPYTAGASCTFGYLTCTSLGCLFINTVTCVAKPVVGCVYSIINIRTCIGGSSGAKSLKGFANQTGGNLDYIFDDMEKISEAIEANDKMLLEYFQDEELISNEEDFNTFLNEVASHIDNVEPFQEDEMELIKMNLESTSIKETYLNDFFIRWNSTVEAWNAGVFSPNNQYPDIIDQSKIEEYKLVKENLAKYTTERGFISVTEMFDSGFNAVKEFQEEESEQEESVCATVTIEFPQTLTMTREAFEGTLTIDNSSEKSITDVELSLVVKNELGEDKSDLFQINKDAFLSGTGIVNPSSVETGVAIFIPTKAAAPQVAQSYSFGGVLSYFDQDIEERVYINLNPVTLEVNPSPDLILDYFLQRNIFGDDPLTDEVVEPSLPAELSLMITNDGYGEAKNVKVESMQPEIVDNEKGLLIDFEMIGSNFNNEPKELGLLEVDYGTIPAKSSSVGQWYFTSSLIGHFVSYDINVNHVSDFSNEELSLIKGAYIHELIKSVKVYEEGNDDIADFLVNDIADSKDTPDMIYLSNGISEEVFEADLVTSSNLISSTNLTTQITVNPFTTGWNYGYITDPGGAVYELLSIVRDTDGIEIPLENFWQTSVTLKDGLNPQYENNLHVLDKITEITTYTLTYAPVDDNRPAIVSIEGLPENESTSEPQELFTVKFNKEIDVNTFTSNNITLISQGEQIPTENILIGKIDETTYSLNLQGLTNLSGLYELTVSSVGVKDAVGNEGQNAERVTWLQFLNELGILQFESDQVKKLHLNSISVVFNKEIRSEEFSTDNITINGAPIDENVSITKMDDYSYNIVGLDGYNQEDGAYTLAIDLTTITAADGSKGLAEQSFNWVVDSNLPEITSINLASQAGIHDQNITEIDITLNRKLPNDLQETIITLTKNDRVLDVPLTILKIDALNYKILGLGDYTVDNATYAISIDQSTLQDEVANFGVGLAEASWNVNVNALVGISNLKITPDAGYLDNDNITSGNNIELKYETLDDNLTVQVFELVATAEILIDESLRVAQGEYSVPLEAKLGAKRFKVIAIDENGNASEAQIISAYIDFSDIDVVIEVIKTSEENDCYDFDYVNVSFSEEIDEATFNNESIVLKSSGIEIPSDEVTITKIGVKNYQLQNITYEGEGSITLEINTTEITKTLSGLKSSAIVSQELGLYNKYVAMQIIGDTAPIVERTYEYSALANLSKYDWIITNGEIISSNNNSVEVKWNAEGEQTLILRYETPFGCVSTEQIKVIVENDIQLSDNMFDDNLEDNLNIGPNPNKGKFSIHTSQQFDNCKIDIYNIIGKNIYTGNNISLGGELVNIDVQNIPPGVYVLIVTHEGEKFDFKIVIE